MNGEEHEPRNAQATERRSSTISVRDRITFGFERWGHLVCGHRRPIIATTLVLCGLLAAQLTFLTDTENAALVEAARVVMRRYEDADTAMYLAGAPVVEERLEAEMQSDIARFLSFAVLAIVVVLFVIFRRVAGVVLPLLTVMLSLPATLGSMALLVARAMGLTGDLV